MQSCRNASFEKFTADQHTERFEFAVFDFVQSGISRKGGRRGIRYF
jgi:hypothetical protein